MAEENRLALTFYWGGRCRRWRARRFTWKGVLEESMEREVEVVMGEQASPVTLYSRCGIGVILVTEVTVVRGRVWAVTGLTSGGCLKKAGEKAVI